jgi:predicted amidohydrolase
MEKERSRTLIQMSSEIGEVKKNVNKAVHLVEEAISQDSKLICLPEMFNTGYFSHTSHCDPKYFELAETIEGETVKTVQRIFSEKNNVTIIVPFFEYVSPGVYHNSACAIENGKVLGCYRKTHMPWSFTGWEKFYMRPGYEYPIFKTSFGTIGILICYDRDFPEAARSLALKGADILLILNGAPISLIEMWQCMARVRAYENQVFVVGACLTGRTDEEHHEFVGNSLIVDPYGTIIAKLDRQEAILTSEIDLADVEKSRMKRFLYRDRRPEIYTEVSSY